jgi:hypothetical protein
MAPKSVDFPATKHKKEAVSALLYKVLLVSYSTIRTLLTAIGSDNTPTFIGLDRPLDIVQ